MRNPTSGRNLYEHIQTSWQKPPESLISSVCSPYVLNGPGVGQPSEKLNVVVEYWLSDDEKQVSILRNL